MFHDMFVSRLCFTICLCISPDLDGNRGTKNDALCPERPTKGPERLVNLPGHQK
jgi:hypothetical protein